MSLSSTSSTSFTSSMSCKCFVLFFNVTFDIFNQRFVPFLFLTIFHILPSLPFFFVPTLNLVALEDGPFRVFKVLFII